MPTFTRERAAATWRTQTWAVVRSTPLRMAPLDGASTTLRDDETADAFWERTLPEYVSKKWLVKDCTQMHAELNGKLVQCTGFEKFPEPRLHCVVLGATSGETVRLPVTNLADPPEQSEQERRNRCFRILDATRLEWRRVYEAWRSDYDRPDFAARVQHLQDAIYAFEAARPAVELTCGEVGEKVEQILAGASVRHTTRDTPRARTSTSARAHAPANR